MAGASDSLRCVHLCCLVRDFARDFSMDFVVHLWGPFCMDDLFVHNKAERRRAIQWNFPYKCEHQQRAGDDTKSVSGYHTKIFIGATPSTAL